MNDHQIKHKNGKIEFMRFAFCLCVIFFHCRNMLKIPDFQIGSIPVTFFRRGYIAVEFFFVVSGYLMAKSIYKSNHKVPMKKAALSEGEGRKDDSLPDVQTKTPAEDDLGLDTAKFIWHKYCSILPYHILVFIPIFFQTIYMKGDTGLLVIKRILKVLPGLFLIQKLGFNYNNINSFEWYISAMLIAMLLLYPICKKYYSMFVHVIAPLGGLYLCGYLIYSYGTLTGASRWIGFTFACVIRAIAEIALGAVAFEGARVFSHKQISFKMKIGLTAFEVLGYIFVFLFATSALAGEFEIYALLLLVVCVMLSFSEQTFGNHIFNRTLFYRLGEFSLPMYLSQRIALNAVLIHFSDSPWKVQVTLVLVMTVAAAAICKILGDYIVKKFRAEKIRKQTMAC